MDDQNHVVAVVTFNVTRDTFDKVVQTAGEILRHRLPAMPGFVEATLWVSEEKTQVKSVTEWQSRHSWAVAQWDDDVARAISDLFRDTMSYDLDFYYPLVRSKASSPSTSSG